LSLSYVTQEAELPQR